MLNKTIKIPLLKRYNIWILALSLRNTQNYSPQECADIMCLLGLVGPGLPAGPTP